MALQTLSSQQLRSMVFDQMPEAAIFADPAGIVTRRLVAKLPPSAVRLYVNSVALCAWPVEGMPSSVTDHLELHRFMLLLCQAG